jgi:uncharacterized membrane protein YdjX (TVP38/TMEM64 family)
MKKRFGYKAAFVVLGFVVTANVLLLVLDREFPDRRALIIPLWIINAPGLPLGMVLGAQMGESEITTWDYVVAISIGTFGSFFWAALAGLIFRRKKQPDRR